MYSIWNIYGSKTKSPPKPVQQFDSPAEMGATAPALLRKVMVVDDEHDLADLAAALLSAHGLEVVVAYSARVAMDLLQQDDQIDAIFSDIVMPGMTGLELADAVREMYPRVKIVLASGYALPSLLANRERPYLYTSKPYKIETILSLLHT
jgi:CheY-like chemotaxis protein